jgi:hypothetical protein
MVTTILIGHQQTGAGDIAIKNGKHPSQTKKAGGGGGGGGAAPESPSAQKPLGGPVKDQYDDLAGVGNFSESRAWETDPGSAKPDRAMVAAFKAGKTNQIPALGIMQSDYTFKPADPVSARIMASAKAAGSETDINIVSIRNRSGSLAAASMNATGKIPFGTVRQSRPASEAGTFRTTPASDISGGKVTASQRSIDRAARQVRSKGGRAIVPVPVRQDGLGTYTVVGSAGANALAIARRANVDPYIYVVSD